MNTQKLALVFFCVFLCFYLILPFSCCYWGQGDCIEGHPLEFIDIPLDDNAQIQLDGIPSEEFWRSEENKAGNLIIPLASNINEINFFIVYLNATFVLTNEYIYLLFEWKDNSTLPIGGDVSDGLYICWNINVVNFSAFFINGMDTTNMGGGNVDCWSLNLNRDSPLNETSYFCQDLCFGDNGWYNPNLEFEDVSVAYNYIENKSYTVEMVRRLTTEDQDYDVQFNQDIIQKFNFGIMDDGDHEDHALSWTYAFDFRTNPIIRGYPPYAIILISFIPIFVIIKNLINRKLKIRNVA